MRGAKRNEKRELSSVGSERLPYKQRVGGSTPSAPTTQSRSLVTSGFFVYCLDRKKKELTIALIKVIAQKLEMLLPVFIFSAITDSDIHR